MRPKFVWNDDNTTLFLTLLISKEESTGQSKSTSKILDMVAAEMRNFGYDVSAAQLKNRNGVLRGEFIAVQRSNNGSGNNPFPCEPGYFNLLMDAFSSKHNAEPPVLSSSDQGTIISENSTPLSSSAKAKRSKRSDDIQPSESENEDDPGEVLVVGQASGTDLLVTPGPAPKQNENKENKCKTNKGNVPTAVKALAQVNVQLETYSNEISKNQASTISLMKQDVADAKKYREDCIALKKQANSIRAKKFKLLKKFFDKQQ